MSVYVDPMFASPVTPRWPYRKACHLFADTRKELDAMADVIGLKRNWFQDREGFPHYDLTASKRRLAIESGCIPVSIRETVAHSLRATPKGETMM